jgi:hypothetical protein
MLKFVKRYVGAVDDGDLEDELSMYADRVDYYHNGSVDRRVIEHSLRKYYTLWPKRDYRLARVVAYSVSPRRGEITITYQVDFSLRGPKGRVKGTTQNRIVINAATSSPRIVAIRETRVRK